MERFDSYYYPYEAFTGVNYTYSGKTQCFFSYMSVQIKTNAVRAGRRTPRENKKISQFGNERKQ